MIAPARVAAYTALRAVTSGRADLPKAIARTRTTLEAERDRALAADIVTGTLRWQARLDHEIGRFARTPVSKLDAEILDILRLSAYQLIYLDRVPARAVVDDAVELARRARKRSAAGYVNAVLRSIAREQSKPAPDSPGLAVAWSHPPWLVARWVERLGLDAAVQWMQFNNSHAPLTLRANRLKNTRDELIERLRGYDVVAEPARYAADGLIVRSGNPLNTPLSATGAFLVQDEASQLVAELAHAQPGNLVLDACASPGGKTTAMAADMNDSGLLVAADLRGMRLDLLRKTVAASGATCIRLVQNDFRAGLPVKARFDLVLVDAPCSGLGTVRRDPDIKWRRSEDSLPHFRRTELAILETAAGAVRPGGRLVYATCSSEPEENDEVVTTFLGEHPEFSPLDAHSWANPGLAEVLDQSGRLRSTPHLHGLEAFFAAPMMRK